MSKTPRQLRDNHQKTIAKIFDVLTYRHSRWTVWADFVTMAACSLSLLDVNRREERSRLYDDTGKRYNAAELELHGEMFGEVIQALTDDPNQDFLGELFMALELGNDAQGQFFTPYSVCQMMARMQGADIAARVQDDGYITVNDPAVGAGAQLVAFANECLAQGINYQESVLFVGQDIDYTAAMMCYMQLSLLGCPGYVIVGDTLSAPPTEPIRRAQNIWFTPMYYRDIWQWRLLLKNLKNTQTTTKELEAVNAPPPPTGQQLTLF